MAIKTPVAVAAVLQALHPHPRQDRANTHRKAGARGILDWGENHSSCKEPVTGEEGNKADEDLKNEIQKYDNQGKKKKMNAKKMI